MLATSLVVGVIPVGGVSAVDRGGYGSPAEAPAIDDASLAPADPDPTSVAITTSNHVGAFPIKSTEVVYIGGEGGKPYYEVDVAGMKPSDPRPIYSLDSGKTNIEYYFQTNNGDQYALPGQSIKFVVGSVKKPSDTSLLPTSDGESKSQGDAERWVGADGKLYQAEIFAKQLYENSKDASTTPAKYNKNTTYPNGELLYGKMITVHEEETKYKVRFIVPGMNKVYQEYEVYKNDPVVKPANPSGADLPDRTDVPGTKYSFVQWESPKGTAFDFTNTKITGPTDIYAKLDPDDLESFFSFDEEEAPTEESSDEQSDTSDSANLSSDSDSESSGVPGDDEQDSSEDQNTPEEQNTPSNQENETDSELFVPDPSVSNTPDTTMVMEEYHELEKANDDGPDIMGTFFADNDPDPIPFDGKKYKKEDIESERRYVCDEVDYITNICDGAFKETSNVLYADIPQNFQKIGVASFKDSGISTINMNTTMTSIGSSAFEGCQALTTINYQTAVDLKTIGNKAFANSSLKTITNNGGEGVTIPWSVKEIGSAAFYGAAMTTLKFEDGTTGVVGCSLGSSVFAKSKLVEVNLDNPISTATCTISNLGDATTAKTLFAQCDGLTKATMPRNFTGTLPSGTFGSCLAFTDIYFLDGGGTFAVNEFDRRQITVHGPKVDSLDPTSSTNVASYKSSMLRKDDVGTSDPYNDYVYSYEDGGVTHEVVNHIAYSRVDKDPDKDIDFFRDGRDTDGKKKNFDYTQKYIFDVNTSNGRISRYYYYKDNKKFEAPFNLEITDNIGPRTNRLITVSGIDDKAFINDTSILNLQLDNNINYVGLEAFNNSKMNKLWSDLNSGGTVFSNKAFYNSTELSRVTFNGNGKSDSTSSIGDECFAIQDEIMDGLLAIDPQPNPPYPKLVNIDFFDDDLKTGEFKIDTSTTPETWELEKYANIGTIGTKAFYAKGRDEDKNTNLTLKGPMIAGYAPYDFARNPSSKITGTEMYTKYYSGNPWNLTAQYTKNLFTRTYVDPLSKKTITTKTFNTGDGAFCLLNYPNHSSKMDKDDIEDTSSTVTEKYLEENIQPDKRTSMESACVHFTHNIVVPSGIEYIDLAKTKINDYIKDYYKLAKDSEDNDIYTESGGKYYEVFKYNPDILSVTFEAGGVTDFPHYMFEGNTSIESVRFKGNVKNIGILPFYMPDTESRRPPHSSYKQSFTHEGPGIDNDTDWDVRSHLKEIVFENETGGTEDDVLYSVSGGIIKGVDGSTKTAFGSDKTYPVTKIIQIAPSRGDLQHPHDDSVPENKTYFGANRITASELSSDPENELIEFAFYAGRDCDAIKELTLPYSASELSYGCFMDCDNLTKVTMPNRFVTVEDNAFAGISQNSMVVEFPYSNANLKEKPFRSMSSDGKKTPFVTFMVNDDAEYLLDYAGKEKNIDSNTFPKDITITYKDMYDNTWSYVVPSVTAGTYGVNYKVPTDKLPSYQGKKPTSWVGSWDGNYTGEPVPDWETTPLYHSAIFTSRYDEMQYTVSLYLESKMGSKVWSKTFPSADGSYVFTKTMRDALIASIPATLYNGTMKYAGYTMGDAIPMADDTISDSLEIIAVYEPVSTSSSSSSSKSSSSNTSSSSKTSSKSTSSKTTSSSNSSSNKSSSSSSSSAYPVFVNSQDAGAAPGTVAGIGSTVYLGDGSGSGGSGGSGSGGNKGSGNTTVVSTTGGISDPSKITATVNGSSDNYVIKITQTQEADEMGLAALHSAYGDDISPIRYLPFDISLYDSTGTNKISPVPEGVSVSITMPIPDDLAIYGGNAKIASTAGGQLDKLQPRFTVINGVPCMTYTCTHLSPYMIYVDTANLTEAGIADATPKTADGIHPKWFLCFGLAAIAIVLFLKKDPEEYIKKAAA
ncbi:MAG: leucine-rich repeat protein [Lachnospiraceae bacterium]|nr:leucine-rich repeat protein [Lachnospiraceae bacterium]